jgi:hypothetical protein
MGGTVPTAEIVEALHGPFVIIPLVNSDHNQHTSNENLRLGNYVNGARGITACLPNFSNATGRIRPLATEWLDMVPPAKRFGIRIELA